MDGEREVRGIGAHLDRVGDLGDEFSGVRPDDAVTDDASSGLVSILVMPSSRPCGNARPLAAQGRILWASIGWPVTSPIARMCGTLVRCCLSTGM